MKEPLITLGRWYPARVVSIATSWGTFRGMMFPFSAPRGWQCWYRAWTLKQPCLVSETGQAPYQSQLGLFLENKRRLNCELPDIQAGFRKGRGTRDQIANICWIIEESREFRRNIYFCFIDFAKAFECVDHNKLWKILKAMGNLPLEKSVCRSGSNS